MVLILVKYDQKHQLQLKQNLLRIIVGILKKNDYI